MARDFSDAKAEQQRAVDALADRDAQKRAAATRDPGRDTSREIATRAKRREAWSEGHSDSLSGTHRTT